MGMVVSGPPSVAVTGTVTANAGSGTFATSLPKNTRSDTYTTTASGTTVDVSSTPMKYWTLACKGTDAAATVWTVVLEGSLDGTNFSTLSTHTNVIGDGVVLWVALVSPAIYFRTRCSSLTLGPATNVVATVTGVQ